MDFPPFNSYFTASLACLHKTKLFQEIIAIYIRRYGSSHESVLIFFTNPLQYDLVTSWITSQTQTFPNDRPITPRRTEVVIASLRQPQPPQLPSQQPPPRHLLPILLRKPGGINTAVMFLFCQVQKLFNSSPRLLYPLGSYTYRNLLTFSFSFIVITRARRV